MALFNSYVCLPGGNMVNQGFWTAVNGVKGEIVHVDKHNHNDHNSCNPPYPIPLCIWDCK